MISLRIVINTDLDSMDLHRLCRIGRLDRIKELVQNTDPHVLSIKLATQKGVFGYTVLHEAVASKNTEILDYLLEHTNAASVNSTAKSGYTPLHMAASSGLVDSVRVLLKYDADVNCKDEYGRTPRSAARLSTKRETEKLLFSEGIYYCSSRVWILSTWVGAWGRIEGGGTILMVHSMCADN